MCSSKVLAVQKIAVTNHNAVITFSQKMGWGRGKEQLLDLLMGPNCRKKHLCAVLQPAILS